MTRRLLPAAVLLFATLPAFAQDRPSVRPDFPKMYGPSWVAVSRPGPSSRPAKLDRDETVVALGRSGDGLAVEVFLWADVADPKKGNKYELRYQLRPHTKKGGVGPLLGTAARPEGVGFTVATATAGDDWMGLEAEVDITRKDLAAATNLPLPSKGKGPHTVLLRVEPQVYDATASKYVTAAKTTAVVVAVDVSEAGTVYEVRTLGTWVAMNRGDTADTALGQLADLDEYDPTASRLEAGIEQVLRMDDVGAAIKAKFVAAIPAGRLDWKSNFNLKAAVEKFAAGSDGPLRASAEKKLAELKNLVERK